MNKLPSEPVALPKPEDRYEKVPTLFSRNEVRRYNAEIRNRIATMGNVRVEVAFFRCPWPCTRRQYERVRKAAIEKWIERKNIDGWQIVGPVKDYPEKRRTAHGMVGDWYQVAVLDEVEIPVAAAFRKLNMKIYRTEVPVEAE